MILGNDAKWNLRKDYDYNILTLFGPKRHIFISTFNALILYVIILEKFSEGHILNAKCLLSDASSELTYKVFEKSYSSLFPKEKFYFKNSTF